MNTLTQDPSPLYYEQLDSETKWNLRFINFENMENYFLSFLSKESYLYFDNMNATITSEEYLKTHFQSETEALKWIYKNGIKPTYCHVEGEILINEEYKTEKIKGTNKKPVELMKLIETKDHKLKGGVLVENGIMYTATGHALIAAPTTLPNYVYNNGEPSPDYKGVLNKEAYLFTQEMEIETLLKQVQYFNNVSKVSSTYVKCVKFCPDVYVNTKILENVLRVLYCLDAQYIMFSFCSKKRHICFNAGAIKGVIMPIEVTDERGILFFSLNLFEFSPYLFD